ncbi:Na+/H+ antiporter NhaC [Virgibacillus pantothenticus]|nr:Na+/H+ antiporter NhaC [Virgibacillus pantothenticus]MEB5450946.1 Na+/H+ antiporter NhaC [Virgibacillus pantothenticus]MEB5455160.1 Na+/H+ antiporter NhaC [Virgibacillus pantothenticus]MEB5461185.1 Na+/H+ antiporter NhaC [Virgibacillus pantothenticus]MEB5463077.1 Na+/H+ antiporter NhaC [Virgibacillus pantothenticus]MEB5467452.1 Na+/H+ antiporter NhaC [Virgibacillus pantothenticus]
MTERTMNMFPIQPKHQPTLLGAITFFIITISLISYFIIQLGTNPHIPIILAIFLLMAYGLFQKIPFTDLQSGLVEGARTGMGAVFLFFLIGILISSWMISGTIPALIDLGFSFIGTTWFYAVVFSITAIIGVSMGSSLTTTATIGVAFIGMGDALEASMAITAGAIVSGAFFGDKMSPLSDTTNLASTVVGVDLFDHIKHISLTTIPAFLISFVLFAWLSPEASSSAIGSGKAYQVALDATNLIHWTSWVPLLLLIVCTYFRVPAFISISLSSLVATGFAAFTSGLAWGDIWSIWFNGYTATTDFEPVNELLTKGGINSMLFTISLVILALGFGGLLFVTGIIPALLSSLQEKLTRIRSIVVSTAATAIGVNILIGEQYLSIMLTGETFKSIYTKAKLPKKVLSRTLEDAGTVINPLVPWSVCGVFIADVLGVPVLTYLPFAFFCLLSPIITMIFSGKSYEPAGKKTN